MNLFTLLRVLLVFSLLPLSLQAQFRFLGSASAILPAGCIEITPNQANRVGAVWSTIPIDLAQPFELYGEVFLGCNDGGADGMAFVMQQNLTSLGSIGGGLGYLGLNPSLIVEFDNYQNPGNGDLAADHIAILRNGNNDHLGVDNLAGPVQALAANANIEDCLNHTLRITWDPATDSLSVYIDCVHRLTYVGDIGLLFPNANPIYWGFTAATGGAFNAHRFCFDYLSLNLPPVDTTICLGDSIQLGAFNGASYAWSPVAGLNDPMAQFPKASPAINTSYIVTITDDCGNNRFDTINVNVDDPADLLENLGADAFICPGQTLTLRAQPTASILWNDNSTADTLLVSASGIYWVEKTNVCGSRRDSITFTDLTAPTFELGRDTFLCDGAAATYAVTVNPPNQILWYDNGTQTSRSFSIAGVYWAELSNVCGTARDSITVTTETTPIKPDFGPDTVICRGVPLILNMNAANAQYLWSDNSDGPTFAILDEGTYWGERFNTCGATRDTIVVIADDPLTIDIGPDQFACVGETLTFQMDTFIRTRYRWNNGATGQEIQVADERVYIGFAENACGSFSDTATAYFDAPPTTPNLGPDRAICLGEEVELNAFQADRNSAPISYLWTPYGDTTYLLTVFEEGSYSVTLTNRCGTANDEVFFESIRPPVVELGPDTTLCEDDMFFRNVTWADGANYLWDNGSMEPERTFDEGGIYTVALDNACGSAADTFVVDEVDCSCTVFMATAFSPNQDGRNDFFDIKQNCDISEVTLEIYNRWGQQVFAGIGADAVWDGRISGATAPEGVYVWVLTYRGRFGPNVLRQQQKGTVTLIR